MLLVISDCFGEEEHIPETEVSAGSSSMDSGKQKPKRKWVLLGGGGRTKLSSNTKGSKSSVLAKETTPEEDATGSSQNRWSTGLPRLPLPATISKETMVSSAFCCCEHDVRNRKKETKVLRGVLRNCRGAVMREWRILCKALPYSVLSASHFHGD